ncbi:MULTISPECIES: DUF624 domain-containing protein [unclassified Clostridium]|uniref:DUF624 domain-containing protein n=1 Tax=unclassified Clostridium TaxID=2614128 RepID=UPI000297C407|nr:MULTISPECIES: DUF624 domain-containing protein [unclassified Clostridium]EKQ50392.1 MAG: putative integral membrane protein [Clostridium sp. Maddingley MBC34-26]
MSKKREFNDGVIVKFFNYVWWFLLANFYFWILNIPFIFVVLGLTNYGTIDVYMIIILMLSSIPIGPALTALLSLMGKLTREGDIDVTKDFFKAYKVNFLDSVFFWTLGIIILTLAWIELLYFNNNLSLTLVKIIPMSIISICIAMWFHIFPIISRFYLKKKEIFALSLMYLAKKIYVCIISIAAAFIIWNIFIKIKLIVILPLFFVSTICYLIMLMEKSMLLDIEKKYNNKDAEVQ